jgi:hypothetical protein
LHDGLVFADGLVEGIEPVACACKHHQQENGKRERLLQCELRGALLSMVGSADGRRWGAIVAIYPHRSVRPFMRGRD